VTEAAPQTLMEHDVEGIIGAGRLSAATAARPIATAIATAN